MSEESDNVLIPSSVVVVPETTILDDDIAANITPTSAKRRKSSNASNQNKRRRLSNDDDDDQVVEKVDGQSPEDDLPKSHTSPPTAAADTEEVVNTGARNRRVSGAENAKDEERKRGKRLFGSLLGTLSQSSSSSSTMMMKQKRRADIDRKQQEKLKLQTEEYNEERKRRLDELTLRRKEEQVLWDEQTMRIRHQNLVATANFLSTKTLPKLYYRPWELRPEEKSTIQDQIDEAERQVARESQDAQPTKQSPPLEPLETPNRNGQPHNASNFSLEKNSTDGNINNLEVEDERNVSVNEAGTDNPDKPRDSPAEDHHDNETAKDAGDENEEMMVEAGEDAVIW